MNLSSSSSLSSTKWVQLVAIHPYTNSDDPTHLKFPGRAILTARAGQEGNPLWYGSYGGREGWFPVCYCRLNSLPSGLLSSALGNEETTKSESRRTRSCDAMAFSNVSSGLWPRRSISMDHAMVDSPLALAGCVAFDSEDEEFDVEEGRRSFAAMRRAFEDQQRRDESNLLCDSEPIPPPTLSPRCVVSTPELNEAPKVCAPRNTSEERLQPNRNESLPTHLQRRRWFGGGRKSKGKAKAEVEDPKETSKSGGKPKKVFGKDRKQNTFVKSLSDPLPPVQNIYIVTPLTSCEISNSDCDIESAAITSEETSFATGPAMESGDLAGQEPEDPIEVWAAAIRSRQQQVENKLEAAFAESSLQDLEAEQPPVLQH